MTDKLDWRIADRNIRLSMADQHLCYLEYVVDSETQFCCDVNLRTAIQLVCVESPDRRQMRRLSRCLLASNKIPHRIEYEHRPKAEAAIAEFKEFFKNWNNTEGESDES